MPLSALPDELLLSIFTEISDPADQYALSLTSRLFARLVLPKLSQSGKLVHVQYSQHSMISDARHQCGHDLLWCALLHGWPRLGASLVRRLPPDISHGCGLLLAGVYGYLTTGDNRLLSLIPFNGPEGLNTLVVLDKSILRAYAMSGITTDILESKFNLKSVLKDINNRTQSTWHSTAMHLAISARSQPLVIWLLSNWAVPGTELLEVAADCSPIALDMLRTIIQHGDEDLPITLALYSALRAGNTEAVLLFLSQPIQNINWQTREPYTGDSAGHACLYFNDQRGRWEARINFLELLWKKHGQFTHRNNHGETALHLAAERGCADMVQWWVGNRLSLRVLDYEGMTARDRASRAGQSDCEKILERAGG